MIWHHVVNVKYTVKILSICLAFLENMNFNKISNYYLIRKIWNNNYCFSLNIEIVWELFYKKNGVLCSMYDTMHICLTWQWTLHLCAFFELSIDRYIIICYSTLTETSWDQNLLENWDGTRHLLDVSWRYGLKIFFLGIKLFCFSG